MLNKQEFIKLIKFGVTGVANTAVDYIVSAIFFNLIGCPQVLSTALGFSCGVVCSYTINRSWTFKTKNGYFSPEFIKFIVVNIIGLLINIGLMALFTNIVFVNTSLSENAVFYISKIIITAVVMILNFVGSRFWVFKSAEDKSNEHNENK